MPYVHDRQFLLRETGQFDGVDKSCLVRRRTIGRLENPLGGEPSRFSRDYSASARNCWTRAG